MIVIVQINQTETYHVIAKVKPAKLFDGIDKIIYLDVMLLNHTD